MQSLLVLGQLCSWISGTCSSSAGSTSHRSATVYSDAGFCHMPEGTLRHSNINAAPRKPFECAVGWIAHYSIGVVFALVFVVLAPGDWLSRPTLLPALLYGIVTVVFPFFIMQPSFGLGVAASRTPRPRQARLKSLATHTVFGPRALCMCACAELRRALPDRGRGGTRCRQTSAICPWSFLSRSLCYPAVAVHAAVPEWAADRSGFLTVSRTAMSSDHDCAACCATGAAASATPGDPVRGRALANLVGILLDP